MEGIAILYLCLVALIAKWASVWDRAWYIWGPVALFLSPLIGATALIIAGRGSPHTYTDDRPSFRVSNIHKLRTRAADGDKAAQDELAEIERFNSHRTT
jgi:hypothetical protein